MDRTRRERKKPAHMSALDKLKEAKNNGKSRLDQLSSELEADNHGDVYELLSEDQYSEMVAKRREENEDFVVDDGDNGYFDDGEEEDWEASEREARKAKQALKTVGRRQLQPSKLVKPSQRIDRAFLGNVVAPNRETTMQDVEEDEALQGTHRFKNLQ